MGMDGTIGGQWPLGAGVEPDAREAVGSRDTALPRDLTGMWRPVIWMVTGIVAVATLVAIGMVAAGHPAGGTVAGTGWIASPPGAYALDPALTGRADFTIEASLEGESDVPQGSVAFELGGGGFVFESTSVAWMSLTDERVKMTGAGTVGGGGDYGFLLFARNAGTTAGMRLKVWDRTTGAVVYDNQPVVPRGHENSRIAPLGGGTIEIRETAEAASPNPGRGGSSIRPVVRWR